MLLSKEETLRQLWYLLEKMPKTIKELSGNTVAANVREAMWIELSNAVDYIPTIEELEEKTYFTFKYYKDEILVGRLEGFVVEDKTIKASIRVLYATNQRIDYTDVSDIRGISMEKMRDADPFKLVIEDLPLHMGDAFAGSLLNELIKNQKE